MSDIAANLTLSVFLMNLRKELVAYRQHASIDVYTPGEILDVMIRSLDQAFESTKGGLE